MLINYDIYSQTMHETHSNIKYKEKQQSGHYSYLHSLGTMPKYYINLFYLIYLLLVLHIIQKEINSIANTKGSSLTLAKRQVDGLGQETF